MINYFINYSVTEISLEEAKRIAKEDLKQLAPYEVVPPDEYKIEPKRQKIYPKQAYERSFRYVASKSHIEGIKLIHGLKKPSFLNDYVGHAWVELSTGFVFDGVLQCFYEKASYYDFYQIVKYNEYNSDEMYEIGYKDGGNYGPWENTAWVIKEGTSRLTEIAAPLNKDYELLYWKIQDRLK